MIKKKKKRKQSIKKKVEIIDTLLDDLITEVKKYSHYDNNQLDKYYFQKRLNQYFNEYYDYITYIKKYILNASSSYDNMKRLNNTK